jgi:diaminopropionate ammonia-lyase
MGFLRSLPGYAPTRLVRVPELAAELGVAEVVIKEEASRLGLPAFKILGASYAIACALSQRLGADEPLPADELRERLTGTVEKPILIAATDGNHGRAVAHTARLLGLAARIFTPSAITAAAKDAIRHEGAEVVEMDAGYDAVVAAATSSAATEPGSILIQDTSWDGYEQVPQWIVVGYGTLLEEADAQLAGLGLDHVDLVAIPVGVGSLAQAVVQHYRSGSHAPTLVSVEPEAAPAILASLRAGLPVTVPTRPTVMNGLNCGTPTEIGWDTLRAGLDRAVAVPDSEAVAAVHDLERLGVDSGPCGAATLAGARMLARAGDLPSDAVVLLLSTESRAANPLPHSEVQA